MNSIAEIYRCCTFIILFVAFSHDHSVAQENDTASIEAVIKDYILGWRNGDSSLLNRAFDLDAGIVLWVDEKSDPDKLKSMKLSELASRARAQEGYGVDYKVQSLEIVDTQIAVAIVKIPDGEDYYIDVLEMQKINGDWKIVLKSFVYFRE